MLHTSLAVPGGDGSKDPSSIPYWESVSQVGFVTPALLTLWNGEQESVRHVNMLWNNLLHLRRKVLETRGLTSCLHILLWGSLNIGL